MPISYTNRKGYTYYLHEKKTKKENTKYYFSKKADNSDKLCEEIPNGYEIYENPNNAQVFLRKEREKKITDFENYMVKKAVKNLKRKANYIVDVKDNEIIIHESDTNPFCNDGLMSKIGFRSLGSKWSNADSQNNKPDLNSYMAVMKFKLVDDKNRAFLIFRYNFRGSIDSWMRIGGPASLSQLVDEYIEILGTDKFYETHYF